MIPQEQVGSVVDTEAYDTSGNKIGRVGQVYLDDETGQPEFATVRTGLFGTKETFVPLAQATFDGSRLTVPFTKDSVKDAPSIDTDGHLSEEEEAQLYQYYGLDYTDRRSNTGLPSAPGSVQSAAVADTGTAGTGTAGTGTAGTDETGAAGTAERAAETRGRHAAEPVTGSRDDTVVAPEEPGRDDVGGSGTSGGSRRLRKYVVTREVRIEDVGDDELAEETGQDLGGDLPR